MLVAVSMEESAPLSGKEADGLMLLVVDAEPAAMMTWEGIDASLSMNFARL
jgi:hypothetical protein